MAEPDHDRTYAVAVLRLWREPTDSGCVVRARLMWTASTSPETDVEAFADPEALLAGLSRRIEDWREEPERR